MPSRFAASITVAPCATSTCLPSTSNLSIAARSDIWLHQAVLVVDVVLEFVAEMLDETLHRESSGIAQRADGASGDVVGHRVELVQILVATLAALDPVDHAPQPAGAFAARRALSAGLLVIEVRQAQQRFHHAARLVHDDDGA